MQGFNWTDAAVASLIRQSDAGSSCSVIAGELMQEFGGILTRNAVIGKLSRLGRSKGRPICAKDRGRITPRPRAIRKAPVAVARLAPPPPTPVKAKPAVAPESPPAGGVRLMDLKEHHCRWPYGDPQHPDFVFCGLPRDQHATLPFCAAHHLKAKT